ALDHDARARPECLGRSPVRRSSAACRVGRLGGREKGRTEHVLLAADRVGLRDLRANAWRLALCVGGDPLYAWSVVETDGSHTTVRAAAARHLAARTHRPRQARPAEEASRAGPERDAARAREGSTDGSLGDLDWTGVRVAAHDRGGRRDR